CRLVPSCISCCATNNTTPLMKGSSTSASSRPLDRSPMSTIAKGLEGIIVDSTSISQVTSETSSLVYRGYPVHELAEKCSFEGVGYLLLYGELPSAEQLADFSSRTREARAISPELSAAIRRFPRTAHPMDVIRTVVSWRGMEAKDTIELGADVSRTHKSAIDLMAKIPTIIAAGFRARH